MDNLTGHNIKGYELRERIGAGGFGAVYKAYQSTVGREVAMKIILPGFANHPDFIRRFETEAQLIARLEHLHITPLYDYWRDPNGAYLIMRWLKGGSLRDALDQGAYSVEAAALLMDQITSALSAAHRSNVIHRDLKPGNILLDEDGNAYLADFGIAKDLRDARPSTTEPDAVVGSLDYIAPEQARGEQVTPRTDIYSLGVLIYELLAGKHPFPNITPVERLYKHLNDPLPTIESLSTDISEGVNAVIQQATAKNPAERYADTSELVDALRAALKLGSTTKTSLEETMTQREQDILQLISEGCSNKEIAQNLFIELATVKWYVTHIYRKLGVRSRVQAMVRARELNLLSKSTETPSVIHIPTEDFQPENPYKGLRAFTSADYKDYFGREKITEKLIKKLAEVGDFSRFFAVIGPSGSGKSSLVKAGLIPAIWKGAVLNSEKWFVVEMMPGSLPLDELEVALTKVAANHISSIHEHLERDENGLLRIASLILPNDGSDLLLVIDQFEEVFTLVEDEGKRQHFLNLLHAAVTAPRSRVRVLVTLRADFYDRPLHYPEFGELVRSRMETVLPLSAEELERAIAKPAENIGMKFEEGLVTNIVSDVNYQPGALPLLQYALTELFEQREGRTLTRAAYQAIGGTGGALAKRAEEIYQSLGNAGQEVARQMFLRLVTLGEGTEDTRRRVMRSELLAITADTDTMEDIIDTYAEYRLLALDNDPDTRAPTVEVAHEAILREWGRLREWLNESRDDVRLQRQLLALASEWHQAKQDASFLLRGSRLEMFEKWMSQTQLALTEKERTYLEASLVQQASEQADEERRRTHELRLAQNAAESAQQAAASQKSAANRLRQLVVVLVMATFGAFALSGFAVNQSNLTQQALATSEANFQRAEGLRLASAASGLLPGNSDNAELAALLAIRSLNIAYSPEANEALSQASTLLYSQAIYERPAGIWRDFPHFLPDGLSAVIAQEDSVELYNIDTATMTQIGQFEGQFTHVTLSPDGQTILIAFADGTVRTWDVSTHDEGLPLIGHTDTVTSVAMSDDGRIIASASLDGTVRLWDAATRETLFTVPLPHPETHGWLDFSPDGHYLTVPYDEWIALIDVQNGVLLHSSQVGFAISAEFSNDNQMFVSAENTGMARVFSVETGEEIRRIVGHTGLLTYAMFSADDRMILTTSWDGTARLWDASTGQELRRFSGHRGVVRYAGFSPDGSQIVTASPDEGTWRVWDARLNMSFNQLPGTFGIDFAGFTSDGQWIIGLPLDGIRTTAYDVNTLQPVQYYGAGDNYVNGKLLSPDGRFMFASIDTQTGEHLHEALFDVETGEIVQTYVGHTQFVLEVAWSPDQEILLTGANDGTSRLWNAASGEQLYLLDQQPDAISGVAFSSDGHTVFTGGFTDGIVRQWDVSSGTLLQEFSTNNGGISHILISADGTRMFAGGDFGLSAWDIASGTLIWQNAGNLNVGVSELSPDGNLIATGSPDGVIRLWNPVTGEQLHNVARLRSEVWILDFSPDGRRVLSVEANNLLRWWDVDYHDAITTVCAGIFRDFSPTERTTYSIGDDIPTCPQFSIETTPTP